MHKLGGEEDFKKTQQTYEAIQFFDDPEMIKNQNTCVVVGGVKENEVAELGLVFENAVLELGQSEKLNIGEETTLFEHDQCEKLNIDEGTTVVKHDQYEKFSVGGETTVFVPDQCEKLSLDEDGLQRDGEEFDDEEVERMINEELRGLVLRQALSEQKGSVDGDGEGNNGWGEYEDEEFEEVGNAENGNGDESWGREEGKFNEKKMMYPLRPDAEDCAFYMKTGSCKYGFHCKFNHPPVPRRKYQVPKDKIKPREEHLERSGQSECKYYLSSGGCKFGNACKYNHSRERSTVSPAPEFNFLGLPIRPGEQECPFYMRTGSCKYGSNCRFHHPDPSAGSGADSSPYRNGAPLAGASQPAPWSSPRALSNAASFVPMMYPPAQGIHSSTDWNGYQAPVYPPTERSLPTPPAFTMNNLGTEASFPSRHHQPLFIDEFPERPGQPECSYFLKTGDCKYKSNCKFHHPKSRVMKSTPSLSDKGLPLRPDQAVCSFYQRYGICKFGPACKFDHPEHLGNSVHSSVSDFEQSSFGNAVA
ncbi:protein phosphatase [Lithospermum erythrorhizon]|uniref:Protein phosphatase n=1 Tax=Lithospermum erythrorhizon TaxID=34254 RepID=A0AAV3P429_LITER